MYIAVCAISMVMGPRPSGVRPTGIHGGKVSYGVLATADIVIMQGVKGHFAKI